MYANQERRARMKTAARSPGLTRRERAPGVFVRVCITRAAAFAENRRRLIRRATEGTSYLHERRESAARTHAANALLFDFCAISSARTSVFSSAGSRVTSARPARAPSSLPPGSIRARGSSLKVQRRVADHHMHAQTEVNERAERF